MPKPDLDRMVWSVMRVAFVHQNMPGQFGRLATVLAADPGNQVAFVTRRNDREQGQHARAAAEPGGDGEGADRARRARREARGRAALDPRADAPPRVAAARAGARPRHRAPRERVPRRELRRRQGHVAAFLREHADLSAVRLFFFSVPPFFLLMGLFFCEYSM